MRESLRAGECADLSFPLCHLLYHSAPVPSNMLGILPGALLPSSSALPISWVAGDFRSVTPPPVCAKSGAGLCSDVAFTLVDSLFFLS